MKLLERGLPAKNDDEVHLFNPGDWFAGKPRSNSQTMPPSGSEPDGLVT